MAQLFGSRETSEYFLRSVELLTKHVDGIGSSLIMGVLRSAKEHSDLAQYIVSPDTNEIGKALARERFQEILLASRSLFERVTREANELARNQQTAEAEELFGKRGSPAIVIANRDFNDYLEALAITNSNTQMPDEELARDIEDLAKKPLFPDGVIPISSPPFMKKPIVGGTEPPGFTRMGIQD